MQVFNVRRKNGLGYDRNFFKNPYLIGALILTLSLQFVAVYVPGIQDILNTSALSIDLWLYIMIGAFVPYILLQVIAYIRNKRKEA